MSLSFSSRVSTNHHEVVTIAERVQDKFRIPFRIKEHDIYSSASIGILHASEKHATAEEMMRDADTAMYQAKRAGKARHEVFDDDMHQAAKETLRMETELRRAVENDQIQVLYQPIYSLATLEVEGLEALVRWSHPELGQIPPEKFIDVAEEIGLIDALGEKVLRPRLSGFRIYTGRGYHLPALSLSINLSSKQFANASLVERIQDILTETAFSPRNLKLEITESVFFEYQQTAIDMLNALRDMGIDLNVDDFGTGYSNLSYLTSLPILSLKIDRSFLSMFDQAGGQPGHRADHHRPCPKPRASRVAEGVESEAQSTELKKLNCDAAQGYYFAHPMSLDDVKEFLRCSGGCR